MKQVTVNEARNILGSEAVEMSDNEVQNLIDNLSAIAKYALGEASRLKVRNIPIITERSKNDSTGV